MISIIRAYNDISRLVRSEKLKVFEKKQPFLYKKLFAVIFMAGFLIGIIYANMIGKKYMDSSGILSDYFLSRYKYFDIVNNNLFWYLLKQRIFPSVVLWITGITIMGIPAVWVYLTWYGFSGGMLISMAVMKFGFKGLILCLGGIMPQYVIYIPIMIILLQKVYQMSLSLYGGKFSQGNGGKTKKQIFLNYLWNYFIIFVILLIGVILESYINPYILKIILKNF